MKKLLSSLLVLVLLFSVTGCASKDKNIEKAQKYCYISAFYTSWGMSVDECITALNLDKDTIEVTDLESNSSSVRYDCFTDHRTFFEQKAAVTFVFTNIVEPNIKLGLSRIYIKFDTLIETKFADKKMQEFLTEQNISYTHKLSLPFNRYVNNSSLKSACDADIHSKIVELRSEWFPDYTKENIEKLDSPFDKVNFFFANVKDTPVSDTVEAISFDSNQSVLELAYIA